MSKVEAFDSIAAAEAATGVKIPAQAKKVYEAFQTALDADRVHWEEKFKTPILHVQLREDDDGEDIPDVITMKGLRILDERRGVVAITEVGWYRSKGDSRFTMWANNPETEVDLGKADLLYAFDTMYLDNEDHMARQQRELNARFNGVSFVGEMISWRHQRNAVWVSTEERDKVRDFVLDLVHKRQMRLLGKVNAYARLAGYGVIHAPYGDPPFEIVWDDYTQTASVWHHEEDVALGEKFDSEQAAAAWLENYLVEHGSDLLPYSEVPEAAVAA